MSGEGWERTKQMLEEVLKVSATKVKVARDWTVARAWLQAK